MSNIGDYLFGETEDASYVGDAPTMTPEQEALLQELTTLLSGQLGTGVEGYSGDLVPGASGIQSEVFNLIQNMISSGGLTTNTDQASTALSGILGGENTPTVDTSALESWWNENVNEEFPTLESVTSNWESTVKDPALKSWQEDVLPVIRENFISQNAGSSSSADRAIASSGSDLMSTLASDLSQTIFDTQNASAQRNYESSSTLGTILANLESGNLASENQALDRILSGSSVASGLDTTNINNLLSTLGIGGEQRDIEGEINTSDYNQWLATQPYNNPWLNLVLGALGQTATEPIVQGPTQTEGILSSILQGLGGTDWSNFSSGS
jgi:hypothetical protein